jgi:hypothetical protein
VVGISDSPPRIIAAAGDNTLHVIDPEADSVLHPIGPRGPLACFHPVTDPEATHVAVAGEEGVAIRDLNTGQVGGGYG